MIKDPKSQREVYETLKPKIMAYLRKYIESKEDREEIVNIAFTKAFIKIDLYSGKGRFDGWISVIAKRTAYDHLRSKIKRREKINIVSIPETYDAPDESQVPESKDVLNMLHKSLEKVSEVQRKAFNLFLDGYTHKEIGDSLGISEGTSKWHIYDVKKKISGKLRT